MLKKTIAQQQPRKQRNPATARKQTVAFESLVYEVLDGRPLYYRGYEDVLAGRKSLESIKGSSSLQWVVSSYFMEIMIRRLDEKKILVCLQRSGRSH